MYSISDLLFIRLFKLSIMRHIFITPTSIQERFVSEKCNYKRVLPKGSFLKERDFKVNKNLVKKRVWLMFVIPNFIKCLYFVSVSFPLGLSDDLVYSIWNSVLTNLRKNKGLKTYLWVAERQKNGTLHFHMFLGNYVRIKDFNNAVKASVLNLYKKKKVDYNTYKSCINYNGVHFSKNKAGKVLNLKKVKKFDLRKRVMCYLTKYVSKGSGCELNLKHHLAWSCSLNLSCLPLSWRVEEKDDVRKLFCSDVVNLNFSFDVTPFIKVYSLQKVPVDVEAWDEYLNHCENMMFSRSSGMC